MATKSSDSYSGSPNYNNKYDKYLYQINTKTIQRKPIFAPILEEPGDIINNLQDLNTSSIPMGNGNNNSSFENSVNGIHFIDYHTMNKFRPSLNLSCLPPVFEIPKEQITNKNNLNNILNITNNQSINNSIYNENNNLNIKLMRGSRLNLKPIINNSNIAAFNNTAGGKNNLTNNKSNFVSLPPINSHTNYNKLKDFKNEFQNNNFNNALNMKNYQQRKKLKPIQTGKNHSYKNNAAHSYNNNHDERRTLDVKRDTNNLYLNKNENQGKYYYNLNNKNILKNEKLKEERALRNKEMSNISINQNKNYIDKNIVILNHKDSNDYIMNNTKNNKLFNSNVDEYVSINKNKSRVFHIPTLKIYDKFDIPAKNYIFFENFIQNWAKMVRGTIKIKNIIENNNLNSYHIIIERTIKGSLGNLLRNIGSLNEYIITFISKQIIPLIKIYNGIFDYRFTEINEQLNNYIDVDYIWFNTDYNVVLYPGKLNKCKNNQNTKKFLIKLFNLNENKNEKIIKKNKENPNEQLNIDLMNFGITLMNINLFILELSVNDLFKLIKNNIIEEYCCLFHYFYNNIKIFSNLYDSLKKSNKLKENYLDFLHNLTSFNIKENNYEKVSSHPFINNSLVINELSNIIELIKIGKMYDFSNEYYTSNSNIISFDLISNIIRKKLNNFKSYYKFKNIKDTKSLYSINNIEIEELCREFKVNTEELHDKLLIGYENLFCYKEN